MIGLLSATAIICLAAGAAQPADAPVILGDRPGDVQQVLGASGPPACLPDGRLVVLYAAGEPGKQVCMGRYSSDSGATWAEPVRLFDFPGGGSFGPCAALVSSKGTLHLWGLDYYGFSFTERAKSKSLLWHARSADGGKSWSAVQYVPFGASYTGAINNACELRSGRLLAPISYLSDRRIGVWVSVAPYSDDDGLTWHPPVGKVTLNTGAADWYESGAAEPVCIELRDGRVWMLPRSQDGFQWQAFSTDGGLHWSAPEHSRFISNQSAMAPLRLRDGRLLLVWNNCAADDWGGISWGVSERAILAAAISTDEGKTWHGYREIARRVDAEQVSYPGACQAADGDVIIAQANGTMKLRPDFLLGTTLDEDFSQGLGRWSTLAQEGAEVVADPDGRPGRVMHLAKPKADASAAASLNIPFGTRGELAVELRIEPGFRGAQFGFTDFYTLPAVPREGCFPVRITEKGRVETIGSRGTWLATPGDLTPGRWHALRLKWDCAGGQAWLWLDGAQVALIDQYTRAPGVCYLRLRSTAEGSTDPAGLYLRHVRVQVRGH